MTPSLHHHQAASINRPRLPALEPELVESRSRSLADPALPSPYSQVVAKLRSAETVLAGANQLQGAGESHGRLLHMAAKQLPTVIKLLLQAVPASKSAAKAEEEVFDLLARLDGAVGSLAVRGPRAFPTAYTVACQARALVDEAATELGA